MSFKRSHLVIIAISLVIFFNFLLWQISLPTRKQGENKIENWTNEALHKNGWIRYKKTRYIREKPTAKEVATYWVINSTPTSMVAIKRVETSGPFGVPTYLFPKAYNYSNNEWWIYPFTVNIPKAKEYLNTTDNGKVLRDIKKWDVRVFKFRMSKTLYIQIQGKEGNATGTVTQKWILDEDTHIAREVNITFHQSNERTRYFIVKHLKGSVFIGSELKMIATIIGFIDIIVLPVLLLKIVYKHFNLKPEKLLQREKERIQSEEYTNKYIKKYEEESIKRRRENTS